MRLPIRLRDPHKLATTTYVNEVAQALNNDVPPPTDNKPPALDANESFIAIPTETREQGGRYTCDVYLRRYLPPQSADSEDLDGIVYHRDLSLYLRNATLVNFEEDSQETHWLEIDHPVPAIFLGFRDGGAWFGCGAPMHKSGDAYTLLTDVEGDATVSAPDTWTRYAETNDEGNDKGNTAITETYMTRTAATAPDGDGNFTLYGFNRTRTIDAAGRVVTISAESRFTIFSTQKLC